MLSFKVNVLMLNSDKESLVLFFFFGVSFLYVVVNPNDVERVT